MSCIRKGVSCIPITESVVFSEPALCSLLRYFMPNCTTFAVGEPELETCRRREVRNERKTSQTSHSRSFDVFSSQAAVSSFLHIDRPQIILNRPLYWSYLLSSHIQYGNATAATSILQEAALKLDVAHLRVVPSTAQAGKPGCSAASALTEQEIRLTDLVSVHPVWEEVEELLSAWQVLFRPIYQDCCSLCRRM